MQRIFAPTCCFSHLPPPLGWELLVSMGTSGAPNLPWIMRCFHQGKVSPREAAPAAPFPDMQLAGAAYETRGCSWQGLWRADSISSCGWELCLGDGECWSLLPCAAPPSSCSPPDVWGAVGMNLPASQSPCSALRPSQPINTPQKNHIKMSKR